jgi:hypothetical protein
MGVPTGPLQYRHDKIRKMLDQMQVPVRSMAHLSALAGFAIVRFCVNTRAGYLARVTDVFEMREHFDRFDCYVDTVLRAIIEADLGLGPIYHSDLQFLRDHMAADRLLPMVVSRGQRRMTPRVPHCVTPGSWSRCCPDCTDSLCILVDSVWYAMAVLLVTKRAACHAR